MFKTQWTSAYAASSTFGESVHVVETSKTGERIRFPWTCFWDKLKPSLISCPNQPGQGLEVHFIRWLASKNHFQIAVSLSRGNDTPMGFVDISGTLISAYTSLTNCSNFQLRAYFRQTLLFFLSFDFPALTKNTNPGHGLVTRCGVFLRRPLAPRSVAMCWHI